jgi:hypothetical protein
MRDRTGQPVKLGAKFGLIIVIFLPVFFFLIGDGCHRYAEPVALVLETLKQLRELGVKAS